VTVELPVAPQILHHLRCQRNHPVAPSLAAAHHQLALLAKDVMHGERKAFGEPQPGAVDQFDGDTIAPQSDGAQQSHDLLTGEYGGKFAVVADADLGKDSPLLQSQHLNVEEPGTGDTLSDGLRLPGFAGFDMQDVVAELRLSQRGRIDPVMLMQQTHGAVVTVPGARRVMAHRKQLGVSPHRVVGMSVIERITLPYSGPRVDRGWRALLALCPTFGVVHSYPVSCQLPSHPNPSLRSPRRAAA